MDSFVPQEDLLVETTGCVKPESTEDKAPNASSSDLLSCDPDTSPQCENMPSISSPTPCSEFEDNESEEIKKICEDDEKNDLAQPIISLTPSPSTEASKVDSSSSPDSKKSLTPSPAPVKSPSSSSTCKTPPASRKTKSASPSPTKRAVFSPEEHKKRVSQFKLREMEKKRALDERRKKQAAELEKKRQAIMKKHEAADRRLQQRSRASPVKSGAFGSTVRSRSSMSLNINSEKHKTGSIQNLMSPKVQLRPQSATGRLKRPVSMGALPTGNSVYPTSLRKSLTPAPRSTKGPVSQPVIKQTKKEEERKNTIKKKVDMKNLMKPTKVNNFTPTGRKTPEDTSRPAPRSTRTSSLSKKTPTTPTNRPTTAPSKQTAPKPSKSSATKPRRSSASKLDTRQSTPVESPTKSVMNSSMQAKVNQQEEAKQRLEEARKKAREERARREEEEKRLAEERRIEEEKKRAEAEEARIRMLKEKEARKKQLEEEAERAKIAEQEAAERARQEEEEKQRAEQERLEGQQREDQEALAAQRRKAEEERLAQEEERKERQKKLDAILKRSSVKLDTPPTREISANASAILAKHNITLNLPTSTRHEQAKQDSMDSSSSSEEATKPANEGEVSLEEALQNTEDKQGDNLNGPENETNETKNDNLLINFGSEEHQKVEESSAININKSLEDLANFNSPDRDQDVVVVLSDDKPLANNEIIENNTESTITKEANEFTIGITSPEELQLSNVL